MNVPTLLRKSPVAAAIVIAVLVLGCSKNSGFSKYWLFLNKPYFTGTITGTVLYEIDNTPMADVTVRVDVRGVTYSATTGADGTFSIEAEKVKRSEGYNVNFIKTNYDDLTKAAIFTSKTQPVDLGTVYMTDAVTGHVERAISGQVLDNYGSSGLAGATVSVQNSHYETIVGVTGADGNFLVSGYYFTIGSSYIVTTSKEHYTTLSTVTVSITGNGNTIEGSPVRLYREYGDIIGTVEDDNTGNPLAGASVSTVDGRGNTVSAVTDGSGGFRLGGTDFYVDSAYGLTIKKTNYFDGTATAVIGSTGDNEITGGSVRLMINGSISGTVRDPDGGPIPGATVQVKDAENTVLATGASISNGTFSLSSALFRKGVSYEVYFTHAVYESADIATAELSEGDNPTGVITLQPKSFTGYTLTGVIADDWDTATKLPASISIADEDGVTRTATAGGATGAFSVTGNFLGGETYTLKVSCAGYTGDTLVDRRDVAVAMTGSSPQSLGQITLFPIGIRAYISGQKKEFSSHIKQTHEAFLTGKTGFTLSARNGTSLNTASTFYVHTDDQEQPAAPDGAHSTTLAINGLRSSGYLFAGIEEDIRTAAVGMVPSTMYHFYVSSAGQFTLETFGTTNTYLVLYDEYGSLVDQADGGGTDNNAKMTLGLNEGWYFVRIRGYDGDIYGFYELGVTGPEQTGGLTGVWTTNDIILSWYDCAGSTVYIAGAGESGSAGSITVSIMNGVGRLSRGSFSGTMRAITQAGATVPVTNGYFNVIRSE
ncbi:MAG TPA: carboxypeptidase regulatory-like domain-containing protein [Spirochaetota bacterium]|nr:carboxypeptidase regulatory-like domain-containing protein [Spirochaetota bacterium]HOD14503.1 carboxypeptidase regulatory-like domain-containing protein [Spirochaetota bacterium]HPN12784.1 carboxypeptidase regulatory-like domain-containing protein [Spirochaetota bacterium]HQL81598.1 carboxypeptidase regulatory-like domain-containing protein [Spirochaetota bacterium]